MRVAAALQSLVKQSAQARWRLDRWSEAMQSSRYAFERNVRTGCYGGLCAVEDAAPIGGASLRSARDESYDTLPWAAALVQLVGSAD